MDHANRSELPLLENALLWAIRAWVIGHNRNIDTGGRIGRMFGNLRAPEAVLRLDAFMDALRLGARRQLAIGCVCQPEISADEALLLDILALLQEACEDEAAILLGRLVAGETVAPASCHALGLVLCLNTAGHYLPRAAETIRRHAFCHLTPSCKPPRREMFN